MFIFKKFSNYRSKMKDKTKENNKIFYRSKNPLRVLSGNENT